MKYRWLDRSISAPGPFMALCLSEEEFRHAVRHLKVTPESSWIKTEQADATVHHFHCHSSVNGAGLTCVVCLRDPKGRTPVEIAGMLVHEAVHIWQEWAAYYGEDYPSREQEAYAIQRLSQTLMAEYARRVGGDQ